MVLSDLKGHKSSAARGDKDKVWTVEGKKATKICFLLPCAFHF